MLRPEQTVCVGKKNKSSVTGAREKVVRDVTGEKHESRIPQALTGQGKNLGLCSQYEERWLDFQGLTF